jgi:hypothetical protein
LALIDTRCRRLGVLVDPDVEDVLTDWLGAQELARLRADAAQDRRLAEVVEACRQAYLTAARARRERLKEKVRAGASIEAAGRSLGLSASGAKKAMRAMKS